MKHHRQMRYNDDSWPSEGITRQIPRRWHPDGLNKEEMRPKEAVEEVESCSDLPLCG